MSHPTGPPQEPFPGASGPQHAGGQYSQPAGGQYPQHGAGPYPQHGGGQYPQYNQQPPKKKHTLRNVLLVIGAVLVLLIGGCTALLVAGGNAVNDAIEDAEASAAAPATGGSSAAPAGEAPAPGDEEYGNEANPVEVQPGKAFTIRGFQYAAGWKLADDGLGSATVEGLKVTNNRGERDSALVEIKLWKGTEVVASVDCTSDDVQEGTTVTLSCFSADDLPSKSGYDRVTINDTF